MFADAMTGSTIRNQVEEGRNTNTNTHRTSSSRVAALDIGKATFDVLRAGAGGKSAQGVSETAAEVNALVAAPDQARWGGRRDRVLMLLAIQTGLRVSELTGLNCKDVTLGTGANVRCEGKGRKQRAVPLTSAVSALLAVWLRERAGRPSDPLFPIRTGRRLSRDAVALRVTTHAATAAQTCHSLTGKRIHPHVIPVDTSVIALWPGHAGVRSADASARTDISIKEKALALTTPAPARPGRYRPTDKVLAFLEGL